jgi:transcriptional regulator with XRE-family HTH domain
VDDLTIGLVLRALRRRRGWRQQDLAREAGCSQALVSNVERGHLDRLPIARIRTLFAAVEARVSLDARWRGADLDRLLDSAHAAVVARVAARLEHEGWQPVVEATYSEFGERGSIDVLGLRAAQRAALVVEAKSDVASSEEVGRKLDEKRRLAPAVVRQRFGWTPDVVGVVLVMPESPRLRRLMEGPAVPLARMFPIDARAVVAWLRKPVGPLAATWFLSGITARNIRRVRTGRGSRIRPIPAVDDNAASVNTASDMPERTILR